MGMPKGCQCYLGPFGAKVLFFTLLVIILTTLHNLVTKPLLWRLLLPPTKLELEHDETIFAMTPERASAIRVSTNKSRAASFGVVVVTAASSMFYPQLANLVGSVQLWEAGVETVVYDLGLHPPQLHELSCLDNVRVIPFPFARYSSSPRHSNIFDLTSAAFKPLVIAAALEQRPKVLYLDAGVELWSSIDFVVESMKEDGFFLAEDVVDRRGKGHVPTDSVQGFVRDSIASREILNHLVECVINHNCSDVFKISTPSSGDFPPLSPPHHHVLPSSPFASLVHRSGLPVKGRLFDFSTVKSRHDTRLLFSRRSHCPKPYIRHVKYTTCPTDFPVDGRDLPGADSPGAAAVLGVKQRRIAPCGAVTIGGSHVDVHSLFKFVFVAELVGVCSLLCVVMRRLLAKNRRIVIQEDASMWTKIL